MKGTSCTFVMVSPGEEMIGSDLLSMFTRCRGLALHMDAIVLDKRTVLCVCFHILKTLNEGKYGKVTVKDNLLPGNVSYVIAIFTEDQLN